MDIQQQKRTIKCLIEQFGGTQASLAKKIKVSQQTVQRWVTGKNKISPKLALQIENITGVPRWKLSEIFEKPQPQVKN